MLRDLLQQNLPGRLPHERRPLWRRYAVAVVVASIGIGLRTLLQATLHDDVSLLSTIAILVAAWYGGLASGLVATLISVPGTLLLFPWMSGADRALVPTQALRLLFLLITGVVISGLVEQLYRTTAQWRLAEEEKEKQVLQERNRLAREIHDTLAQGLTGIIIQLEAVEDVLPEHADTARDHLRHAANLARQSLTEARHSVQALRPEILDERGLSRTLAQYVEQMSVGTGVRVDMTVEGVPPEPGSLPPDVDADILRIALGAVTNSLKHARARRITVALSYLPQEIRLAVADDGIGFVPSGPRSRSGFGLTAMRERAERIGGALEIDSQPDGGTCVRLAVPVPKDAGIVPLSARRDAENPLYKQ